MWGGTLHNKSRLRKKCGEGDFVAKTNRLVVANLSLRMSLPSGGRVGKKVLDPGPRHGDHEATRSRLCLPTKKCSAVPAKKCSDPDRPPVTLKAALGPDNGRQECSPTCNCGPTSVAVSWPAS